MDTTNITVAQGYIDQRDIAYEDHRRGTNYIATVYFSPSQPGGLARTFWPKGSGSFRGVPDALQPGDIIEVAHDYTSGGGNKSRGRDYYRVVEVAEDELVLADEEKPTAGTLSAENWLRDQAGETPVKEKIPVSLADFSMSELQSEIERRRSTMPILNEDVEKMLLLEPLKIEPNDHYNPRLTPITHVTSLAGTPFIDFYRGCGEGYAFVKNNSMIAFYYDEGQSCIINEPKEAEKVRVNFSGTQICFQL